MTYKIVNTSHKSIPLNNGTRLKPYGFTYINESDVDNKLHQLIKMGIIQIMPISKNLSAEVIVNTAMKKKKAEEQKNILSQFNEEPKKVSTKQNKN